MPKREFLGRVTVGTLMASAHRGAAAAEPIRILGDRRSSRDATPSDATPSGERSPEVEHLMAQVRVGRGRSHGQLRVLWLYGPDAAPPPAVATLDEARGRGALVIRERGDATVNTIVADNQGQTPVLLLAGEIVLGGKQNRVVADDLLLPAVSGPVEISVYCVERGRWVERGSREFGAPGSFTAPTLRARVVAHGAQSEVWAEVSRYAAAAQASSPTGSYQAIYDRPEVRAHQEAVAHAIAEPPPGALGAAVFIAGRVPGLDLFQPADLFRREWGKLLSAQALETYGRHDEPAAHGAGPRARVEDLIRRAAIVKGTLRRTVGAGVLFEFSLPSLRGAALIAEGRVIHAALL